MIVRGYPISLNLAGRKCLVVGGGAEAALRARSLLEAGAKVLVVAETEPPQASEPGLEGVAIEQREFGEADLDDAWLVVQVTRDAALSAELARHCERRRVFFCAVDQPKDSSYSHLALARAGALTVAVGTEGQAPALARRLREELSRLLNEAGAADEVARLAALRAETPDAERREVLGRAVAEVHFTGVLRFKKP
jgi:precorrin-2 dehydrogenase/sirohydrochlorin ferrochelatase